MAISKAMTQSNGIALNYHRIVSVNTVTNVQTSIEVQSYISEEARLTEKQWYENMRRYNELSKQDVSLLTDEDRAFVEGFEIKPLDVYIQSSFHVMGYDPYMNVNGGYDYLKSLPEYEGCMDVFE